MGSSAARREADGVLEEVRQYLVDLNRVGWHIGRIPQDRPDAHATQHRLHPVEDGRHNLDDRRGLELHRPFKCRQRLQGMSLAEEDRT